LGGKNSKEMAGSFGAAWRSCAAVVVSVMAAQTPRRR
jgi:hypothetical protein